MAGLFYFLNFLFIQHFIFRFLICNGRNQKKFLILLSVRNVSHNPQNSGQFACWAHVLNHIWCCSLHLHIDFLATISKTLARLPSHILVKPPQCSLYSVHPSIFHWNNTAFNAFWHLCGSKNTVWFVSWMVCLVNACLCATATFCSSVLFSSGF